ncbi:hypothetical protein IJG20_03185, partial [Candidatus Saccharibacteria bacterium]|nr:hypothetical protein [Candidatus Saccharibacteria bacterium]
ISQRRVATLCSEGRIIGAMFVGNSWVIPCDAVKPMDARTKAAVLFDILNKYELQEVYISDMNAELPNVRNSNGRYAAKRPCNFTQL